jgi:quinohemoprotein ethanol dehydrogenase
LESLSESPAEPEGSASRKRRSTSVPRVISGFLLLVLVSGALAAIVLADNADNSANRTKAGSNLTASEAHGRQLFASSCAACHTLSASNAVGRTGPNLDVVAPNKALVATFVKNGAASANGLMPPGLYTGTDLDDVSAYVARVTHPDIPKAGALSADDVGQQASSSWLTNGGGYSNDRFSSLDQINTSNVSDLKGEWMTHLNGSGTANKYSQEGQPIEYKGILYVTTGADDVFAVDVKTGKTIWTYTANMPDELASTICCGWDNRGVALGDGLVFSPQLDGSLIALDQKSGEKVWKAQVAPAKDGYAITAAPLYYDGLVYTAPAGADYGGRGFVDAYDAKTGHRVWRHYNVPKPGEEGAETWPKDNDSWKHGGANVWATPSIDPELGLIYYSTANAGSDWDGSQRAGDNLFSASILAVNAKTGKMKWYYQQIHHDIWDYDSTSPTVLIDAKIDGKDRKGIAEPNKDGYVYFLDRETGKPIFPIKETPVAQSKEDATSPTQPIPTMAGFSPQQVTPLMIKALKTAIGAQLPAGSKQPTVKAGHVFDIGASRTNTVTAVAPSAAGGDNWPPSSYNPDLQMYYVCSQSGAQAFLLQPEHEQYTAGKTYEGNVRAAGITGFNTPGLVTAYDMTTGKIVWQKKYTDACYSGTMTTAGGLVFVGRNKGELEAYDGKTGKTLWSFQTGAGANTTATSFEEGGKQYMAFLAGGNALGGTAKGDNLWLFSLDGKLGPAAAPGSAKAIQHAGESAATDETGTDTAPTTGTKSAKGDAGAGKQIFADNCSTCHGLAGTGGNGGPNLKTIAAAKNVDSVVKQVINGGGGMPAFGGQLSSKEIADVAAYVTQVITGGKG